MSAVCGASRDLESCLLRRLGELFGRALPAMLLRTIAHELAAATASWLAGRAHAEVFGSRAELALRAAAEETWTPVNSCLPT